MKNSLLFRLAVFLSLASSSALSHAPVPPARGARYPGITARTATAPALPRSFQATYSAPGQSSLPPLDPSQLDQLTSQSGRGPKPPVVGLHRPLEAAAMRLGTCEAGADGNQVWRLAVQSPGAKGIRLHLQGFNVAAGTVWLYDRVATE
jgi:hypothetical protein